MKPFFTATALSAALLFTGCTWTKVPTPPAYKATSETISIKTGVTFKDDAAYGSRIVAEMRKNRIFSETIYPTRPDDKLDAVIDLDLRGGWDANNAKNLGSALLNGATLGLSGTTLGMSMTGHHDLTATMYISGSVYKIYEIKADNTVEFGMYSNKQKLIADANDLQIKTLSNQLMSQILADKEDIVKKAGR